MEEQLQALGAALEDLGSGSLAVITGAGISQASGIPTFRGTDPKAIWRQSDVSLATFEYFRRDPVGQWQWYLDRFEAVAAANPNPAHSALVDLETWHTRRSGSFCLVTQNIDTLHEAAGSSRMIKIHGTSDRVRCSKVGCRFGSPRGSLAATDVRFGDFVASPCKQNLPTCPECSSILRAHVLFFDEYYGEHQDYKFSEAEEVAQTADLMLFIGTSFSVGITDIFLRAGILKRIPIFSIDPGGNRSSPWPDLQILPSPAEELLPEVCRRLHAHSESTSTADPSH
ncbi:MAG: Sir2 family NAD-dependent protein deacetylase [Thermoanaerobaculia bacterium]